MNRTLSALMVFAVAAVALTSCVDHRPIRNGLKNESIYIDKDELTRDGWLHRIVATKVSTPSFMGDWILPGMEGDVRYVNFRFYENSMQVIDAMNLQYDDPDNPGDDLNVVTDRVMLEFGGSNVDIKLRESLDGERTNFLEENTEEPWQNRQKFKLEPEDTNVAPMASIAWYYAQYIEDCSRVVSVNYVPDSFDFDEEDQHMSWEIEVTYEPKLLVYFSYCETVAMYAHGSGTTTQRYKYSFYRPPPSDYVPEVVDEKAEVNKKYGLFQETRAYRDPVSGELGARSLLRRWNPNRPSDDPVTFYFHEGFPPRYKPMFDTIKAETNRVLEEAGATLRFDFKDHNWDGVERTMGDMRYSMIIWINAGSEVAAYLGFGPSSTDPRTGEIINANLHFADVGLDYYRFLLQDFLEENGAYNRAAAADAAGMPADTAWEDIQCTVGESVASATDTQRLSTPIWEEMRRAMELDATNADPTDDFIPTPLRNTDEDGDGTMDFLQDYHRTLPEYRYINPAYNQYVWLPGSTGTTPRGFGERLQKEQEFQDIFGSIMMNQNPFGGVPATSPAGIEKQLEFSDNMRDLMKNHERLEMDKDMLLARRNIYPFSEGDAITTAKKNARQCQGSLANPSDGRWESDETYIQRIIDGVVFKVLVHEFGHNLSLSHNFYGSVDAKHFRPGDVSASVMDYQSHYLEVGTPPKWGLYDEAAIKWAYGSQDVRDQVMQDDFLFCHDAHRRTSPLCQAFDFGVTPAQIVLNAIETYDWGYKFRNQRAYRTYWNTNYYASSVYSHIFSLLRIWYLAIFDWGGGGVQDVLKRLDQLEDTVKTDQEYDEIAQDFYNDIIAANAMIIAFYNAVVDQPASFRNYQTEFDPFYGDPLRIGIIIDKLFATYAFMDLQETWNYNPNVYTYVAMYDAAFGAKNVGLSQRVLDNMLGARYDTFPWFRYTAINYFAWATNSNLVGDAALKERIGIRRFDRLVDFEELFGMTAIPEATAPDNESQLFYFDGEEYAYTYLPDRNWHLVAGRSRNSVSYQFIKEYNEDLNAGASTSLDNYGLKILLAYHEYYNNFTGF